MDQSIKPEDGVDEIRKRLGIVDQKPKAVAGGALPTTMEQRQKAYEQEMKMLAAGGYDYGGLDGWAFMRGRKLP